MITKGDLTIVRIVRAQDAFQYMGLLKELDCETPYMLYKPNERKCKLNDVVGHLSSVERKDNSAIFGAFRMMHSGADLLIGYIGLFGGKQERIRQVVSLSMGVLSKYHGQGVGSMLLDQAFRWSENKGIRKFELTVRDDNKSAIRLYTNYGFDLVGVLHSRIYDKGKYINELVMERFING